MQTNTSKNLGIIFLFLSITFLLVNSINAGSTYSNVNWSNVGGAGSSSLTEIGAYYMSGNSIVKIPYSTGSNLKGQSGSKTISGDITKLGQYTCYTYAYGQSPACYYSNSSQNSGINHVQTSILGTNSVRYNWEDSYWHIDFNDLIIDLSWNTYTIVCSNNSDCNDNNPRTEDVCTNPGTQTSSCIHNNIRCLSNSDCGTDSFTGNAFCYGNGIFQNYNSFTCNNPGTTSSSCTNSITQMLKQGCLSGQICNNALCITTQCSNGIDDDSDGLTDSQDPGCWNNIDDPNSYNPVLSNESRAGIACFTSAQCGRDGYIGDKTCQNGNVVQDYKTYSCANPGKGSATCSSTTTKRNIQSCSNGCSNGQCIVSACSVNSDCNDNDLYTVDECNNPGTAQSACTHTRVNCVNDNDCGITGFFGTEFCSNNDVFKNYKNSKCINPGTKQSNCQITTTPNLLLDCGDNSCDSYSSNYCKSGNVYHQRTCNDNGCNNGRCFSTPRIDESLVQSCAFGCLNGQCKPECSSNSDCSNGKVCSNNYCVAVNCNSNSDCNDNNPNTEDTCLNPGTTTSSCQHNLIRCMLDTDCGTSGFLNQTTYQNGSVYDLYIMFMCHNPGTSTSTCMNHTEYRPVSICTGSSCNNGSEGSKCSIDSDCRDYASINKFCSNNSVFENYHDLSCVNSVCVESSMTQRLFETCDYRCSNGACKEKTNGALNEEETTETTPLILSNKLSKTNSNIIGSVSEEANETLTVKLGQPYQVNSNNIWYLFWIILIILLIIVLIIIIVLLSSRR